MKKAFIILLSLFLFSSASFSQFTFYLIDNFESGKFLEGSKWWRFGDLDVTIVSNPKPLNRDLIAESCGDYSLNFSGRTNNWYVGGIGTDLGVDASRFSRFQIDIYGNDEYHGKIKIEFFDDDNFNYSIEQDPKKDYDPVYDDKWVAEITIQGKGFTRTSIPFTAFYDVNPGVGDDIWNPNQEDGSGGLLKMQLVAIAQRQKSKIDFNVDNFLLTF
ncbi:MAG: hypothetical protein HQ596_03445 [Candidatus Saganbacteria bacterium]|nr:hypothetical protein [Candidatus Saganbacteria bacterium]